MFIDQGFQWGNIILPLSRFSTTAKFIFYFFLAAFRLNQNNALIYDKKLSVYLLSISKIRSLP